MHLTRILLIFFLALPLSSQADRPDRPNIVYIMSDELAYYEVGFMGAKVLKTPRIDQLAVNGLYFTCALAGAPVCAPLRCNLMTGKHAGHASVRANDGGTPLRADEETIASLLKKRGYATGGFGKWGCGGRDSTGVPEKHGFDTFFGYYDQVHAHSFYPPYLIHNSEEVPLKGNVGGRSGKTYAQYEIMREGLQFIRDNKDRPFFAYFPITPPHGMYDIPTDDPAWASYKDVDMSNWPREAKNYAAMVTMVDRDVGTIVDLLEELKLSENTILFFAGDNGGQDRFRTPNHPRGFFGPNKHPETGVEFRGGKGNLYEGGLRVPSLVYWPGQIEGGRTSDLIWYQPDILPTLTELTGSHTPKDIDGLSILPEILGEKATGRAQEKHEFLYWEYGNMVAVRIGQWKIVQHRKQDTWEVYDLSRDISETTNVAGEQPEILARAKALAAASHEEARPGTFSTRERHERDRWAKWGDAREAPKPKPKTKAGFKGDVPTWPVRGLVPGAKIASASSEQAGKQAALALDSDPRTWWHSRFSPTPAAPPHELVIDLGTDCVVTGFRYMPRTDNGWNGALGDCEITVMPAADAAGIPPQVKHQFKKKKAVQEINCDPVRGRFVRLKISSSVVPGSWASVAEFGVVGKKVK